LSQRLHSIDKAKPADAGPNLRWHLAAEKLTEFYRSVLPSVGCPSGRVLSKGNRMKGSNLLILKKQE
jgi:hypothetical protein